MRKSPVFLLSGVDRYDEVFEVTIYILDFRISNFFYENFGFLRKKIYVYTYFSIDPNRLPYFLVFSIALL